MAGKKENYKLRMDLIPGTMWYKSLYRYLNKAGLNNEWLKIKDQVFKKEGKKCWICGKEGEMLSAHECWSYDEKKKIQKLEGIHHLCIKCHMIQHYGFAGTDDGAEFLKKHNYTFNDLKLHFCKINNCSEKDFEKHKDKSFKLHSKRSKYSWDQDWGEYNILVDKVLSALKKTPSKK